jgi:hypothetical protein
LLLSPPVPPTLRVRIRVRIRVSQVCWRRYLAMTLTLRLIFRVKPTILTLPALLSDAYPLPQVMVVLAYMTTMTTLLL